MIATSTVQPASANSRHGDVIIQTIKNSPHADDASSSHGSDGDGFSDGAGGWHANGINGDSPGSPNDQGSSAMDTSGGNGDAEGVWSQDIEQAFQEALSIYPPCGRRKIILSDEGKMYGRNELIARYIKLRTGKTRTRKQVSSHIQVLARKKSREVQAKIKYQDPHTKKETLSALTSMSSAQIVSAGVPTKGFNYGMYNGSFWGNGMSPPPGALTTPSISDNTDIKPNLGMLSAFHHADRQLASSNLLDPSAAVGVSGATFPGSAAFPMPAHSLHQSFEGRSIRSSKLRLLDFTAYCELEAESRRHILVHVGSGSNLSDPLLETIQVSEIYDKFPETKGGLKDLFENGPRDAFYLVKFWGDINFKVAEDFNSFFFDSQFESSESMVINVSTKVCSFGKQVVEKVEGEYPRLENGRYFYQINQSPMCEYMCNFVHKLKQLPNTTMMNSVLANFTILQFLQRMVINKQLTDLRKRIARVRSGVCQPSSNYFSC